MILTVGLNERKLFVYSQASIIQFLEPPTLTLPWRISRVAPTETVGSRSASTYICVRRDVVVVFP